MCVGLALIFLFFPHSRRCFSSLCVFVSCVSATTEIKFEAKAFQGPWDEEPVWKVYKVIDCPPSAGPKRSFSRPGEGGAERVTGIDARWLYSNENYLVEHLHRTSEDLYCSFRDGAPSTLSRHIRPEAGNARRPRLPSFLVGHVSKPRLSSRLLSPPVASCAVLSDRDPSPASCWTRRS